MPPTNEEEASYRSTSSSSRYRSSELSRGGLSSVSNLHESTFTNEPVSDGSFTNNMIDGRSDFVSGYGLNNSRRTRLRLTEKAPPVEAQVPPLNTSDSTWCYCEMPERDFNDSMTMVECSAGDKCKDKWFHFSCIGKSDDWLAPDDWKCPRCVQKKF